MEVCDCSAAVQRWSQKLYLDVGGVLWRLQDSFLTPILALQAIFKISNRTDFGLESQNFRGVLLLCVKKNIGN